MSLETEKSLSQETYCSSSSSSDGVEAWLSPPVRSTTESTSMEIPKEFMMDCQGEIDRILDFYEQRAEQETVYLLETTHHLPSRAGMIIKTGISPSRTFGSSVILADTRKVPNIAVNFGFFQWVSFIHQLKDKCASFFEQPLDQQHLDDYEPISYKCDSFITLTQMIWDDTKFLRVERCGQYIYMEETEVRDILHFDEHVNSHKMLMLEKLEFAMYFHNLMELAEEMVLKNNNLNAMDLLHSFCNVSNSIHNVCLREYLFYYKDTVLTILNNKMH